MELRADFQSLASELVCENLSVPIMTKERRKYY